MKWVEVKVCIDGGDGPPPTDLISDIFYDLGLQGVAVEDADVAPGTAETGRRPDAVTAYLPKDENLPKKLAFVRRRLAALAETSHSRHRMVLGDLDEADWAESWKAFFWPQRVGRNIVIKPTWRKYAPQAGDIVVEIDPGMAFGTGTHATTRLCLEMLETYLRPGDALLDIGTGSGILLAAAASLGASKLIGVDNDLTAVRIARKNLLLNSVDPAKCLLIAGHLVDPLKARFNLITANILTETIAGLLDRVRRHLRPGAVLICSGILAEKKETILSKMKAKGFDILEIAFQEEWTAIAAKR